MKAQIALALVAMLMLGWIAGASDVGRQLGSATWLVDGVRRGVCAVGLWAVIAALFWSLAKRRGTCP